MVHARPAASRTPPRASKAASPRFRLWNHLRRDRRPRSLGEIYAAVAIEPEHMFSLLDDWSGRGLLLTQVNPVRFLMTEAARAQGLPPRANNNVPKFSGRQRLWAAMRVLKTFDLQTICMASETSHKGAVEFLRALGRTGYVTADAAPVLCMVWRFVRYTGPKHPIVRYRKDGSRSIVEVEDRNDGRRYRDVIDLAAPGSSDGLGKAPSEGGGVS